MHPAMIQAALKVRGVSQAEIARRFKRNRSGQAKKSFISAAAVHSVIWGRSRSERIEREIAAITGLTRAELWPQWHGADALQTQPAREQVLESFRTAQVPALKHAAVG
jgi:lambda repressor-like predicted transcriptional regulator